MASVDTNTSYPALSIRVNCTSPPPTFNTAKTHQTWKQNPSGRRYLPRLDTSEATPSDHSSILDAAHVYSDEEQASFEAGSKDWCPSNIQPSLAIIEKENFRGRSLSMPHLFNDPPTTTLEMPLRAHGSPLDTILETSSHVTLLEPRSLLESPLPQPPHYSCSLPDAHFPRQYGHMRRKWFRSLDESELRRQAQIPKPNTFSEDSCLVGNLEYASPRQPSVPALARLSTPPGYPRWPGDLPTSNPANAHTARRTTSAYLRNVFRKLVASAQKDRPNARARSLLPTGPAIPPHLIRGGRTGEAYYRPINSGHVGRSLDHLERHPFHNSPTEETQEKEVLTSLIQNTMFPTAATSSHAHSMEPNTSIASSCRAIPRRASSLLSLPSRLFASPRVTTPTQDVDTSALTPTGTTAHSVLEAISAPTPRSVTTSILTPAPLTIRSVATQYHETNRQTPDSWALDPVLYQSQTDLSIGRRNTPPCRHDGLPNNGHTNPNASDSVLDYYVDAQSIHNIETVALLPAINSTGPFTPTNSIVTGQRLCQQTPLGASFNTLSDPFITPHHKSSCHTPPQSVLAPSPLRPGTRIAVAYQLFPPPAASAAPSSHRPLSSMLRQRRGLTSPLSRPTLEREQASCPHGKPCEPASVLMGAKVKTRTWWRAAKSPQRQQRAQACWRCRLQDLRGRLAQRCCGRAAPKADRGWEALLEVVEEATTTTPSRRSGRQSSNAGGPGKREERYSGGVREIGHRLGNWLPTHCFGQVVDDVSSARSRWPARPHQQHGA